MSEAKSIQRLVLPCPFCGDEPEVDRYVYPTSEARIWCRRCDIGSPTYTRLYRARAWWNRRKNPTGQEPSTENPTGQERVASADPDCSK